MNKQTCLVIKKNTYKNYRNLEKLGYYHNFQLSASIIIFINASKRTDLYD